MTIEGSSVKRKTASTVAALAVAGVVAGGLMFGLSPQRAAPTAGPDPEVARATALLQRPEEVVRRQALQSLNEMGPLAKSAIPAVLSVLHRDHGAIRGEAALALAALDPSGEKSLPGIREALHDADAEVEELAALAMGILGPAAADGFADVSVLASSSSPEVRAAAVYAQAKLRPTPDNVARVYALLAGDEPRGQFMALRTLRELGATAVVDPAPIIAKVQDPNVGSSVEAMRIVRMLGERGVSAVPELLAVFDDDARCSAALLALVAVDPSGARVVPALSECTQRCSKTSARTAAAAGLARFPALARETRPTLLALLGDEDPRLAMSALGSLETLRPAYEEVREGLLKAIGSGESALSWRALQLAISYGEVAMPDVLALQAGSKRGRLQAAYALGRMPRSETKRQALTKAALDSDHDVQAQAELALREAR